jgi:hypothetical protein
MCNAAPGTAAKNRATRSSRAKGGALAAATTRLNAGQGETSSARKSAGCTKATSGPAAMFDSGAIRLMRPNVHAMHRLR